MSDEKKKIDQEIYTACSEILSEKIESLVRTPAWGEVNFDEATQVLNNIKVLAQKTKETSLAFTTEQEKNSLKGLLTEIAQTIAGIKTYRISNPGHLQQKAQLIAALNQQYTNLLKLLKSIIPISKALLTDENQKDSAIKLLTTTSEKKIRELTNELEANKNTLITFIHNSISELHSETDNKLSAALQEVEEIKSGANQKADFLLQELQKKADDAANITLSIKELAANAGISQHATHYSDEAIKLYASSRVWFLLTALSATITIAMAVYFLKNPPMLENKLDAAYIFFSKALLISITYSATIWCSKIYKTIKHQETLSTHRANCLKTFSSLINSAFDETSKSLILIEASKTIFTASQTGFIDENQAPLTDGAKTLEIIRNGTQSFSAINKQA